MEDAIPTDSVLRRHYEASKGETKQTSQSAATPSSNSSGGFMSWLKSLFGG